MGSPANAEVTTSASRGTLGGFGICQGRDTAPCGSALQLFRQCTDRLAQHVHRASSTRASRTVLNYGCAFSTDSRPHHQPKVHLRDPEIAKPPLRRSTSAGSVRSVASAERLRKLRDGPVSATGF